VDIGALSDHGQDRTDSDSPCSASVHDEVHVWLLAESVLERFERERARAL
jgi:hypothetical protein